MPFSDVMGRDSRGLGRLARKGNRGDTMLAHINPEEARLLKMMGGSGTINPKTGLPQFYTDPGKRYLETYTDVAKDPFFAENPWEHFRRHGRGEGRQWNPDDAQNPSQSTDPNAPYYYDPQFRQTLSPDDPRLQGMVREPLGLPATGSAPGAYTPGSAGPLDTTGALPKQGYYYDPEEGYRRYVEDYQKKYPQDEDQTARWAREAKDGETPAMMSKGQWLASAKKGDVIFDDPEERYRRYVEEHDRNRPTSGESGPDDYLFAQPDRLSYDDWYNMYKTEKPEEPAKYTTGQGDHLKKTDADYTPPTGWDPDKYLKDNPDLQDDPWAAANPLAHFMNFGKDEGRHRLPGGYNAADFGQAGKLYLERNPDVLEAATSYANAANKYLEANPDVKASNMTPWQHYQTFGKKEGRKWEGGEKIDPWEHYELYGKGEGRKWQGEEPRIDFSKAQVPGGDNAQRIGSAIRAVQDGFFIVPPSGDTPFAFRDEPGKRIPVDRYGWMEVTGDQRLSSIPVGSHYNILTNKWLSPGEKPSMSKKGQELPPRPGGNDVWDFWGGFMVGGNPFSMGGNPPASSKAGAYGNLTGGLTKKAAIMALRGI